MRLFVSVVILFLALIAAINAWADRNSPVEQGVITSGRGWRKDPFGSGKLAFHRGYDISVPMNTPVYPTQVGKVYFAGWHKGYGNLVVIDHGNSYVTMYGHNNKLKVKTGQVVDTNTVIALAGSTGRSTGPHVHYEVRRWPGERPVQAFTETVQPTLGQGQVEPNQQGHDSTDNNRTWVDDQVGGM